jgi:hypothetical protein
LDCIQPESQRMASSPCSPFPEKLFKKHFLTALVMPGDRERCFGTGVNEYLSKPVHLKTLADMIEKLTEQKSEFVGKKYSGDMKSPLYFTCQSYSKQIPYTAFFWN